MIRFIRNLAFHFQRRSHKRRQAGIWPKVIETLQTQRYDPQATRNFELLSGAFFWSDEVPSIDRISKELYGATLFHLKPIFCYRASLIRGEPDKRFRGKWEFLQQECPSWPGFRPERQSQDLRAELKESCERSAREVERLFRACDKAKGIAEARQKRESLKS